MTFSQKTSDFYQIGHAIQVRKQKAKCPVHGEFERFGIELGGSIKWSHCPQCAKQSESEDLQSKIHDMQAEAKQNRLRAAMEQSGIAGRLQESSFESFNPHCDKARRALAICRKYVEKWDKVSRDGVWLALVGLAGTGKTFLGAAIANALIASKRSVLMIRAADLSSRVKTARVRGEENPYVLASTPDLLIVDEMPTGEIDMDLYLALDTRYMLRKPTVLIGNHQATSGNALSAFDHRIADRVRDMGGAVIYCDWQSYRERHRQGEGWLIEQADRHQRQRKAAD